MVCHPRPTSQTPGVHVGNSAAGVASATQGFHVGVLEDACGPEKADQVIELTGVGGHVLQRDSGLLDVLAADRDPQPARALAPDVGERHRPRAGRDADPNDVYWSGDSR